MEATLNDAAATVARTLGGHHRELAYQRALGAELRARGHTVVLEYPLIVWYTGSNGQEVVVDTIRADILIDSKVVVEVKVAAAVTASALEQAGRYGKIASMPAYVVAFSREGGASVGLAVY